MTGSPSLEVHQFHKLQFQFSQGKVRQEVSTQARQILGDVVEDFATVEGVMERFEQWKEEDGASYNDAYVSLCLPKVVFVTKLLPLKYP